MFASDSGFRPSTLSAVQHNSPKPTADSVARLSGANFIAQHSSNGKVNTPAMAQYLNRQAMAGKLEASNDFSAVAAQLSIADRQIMALDIAKDLTYLDREHLGADRSGRNYLRDVYKQAIQDAPANAARPEVSALMDGMLPASAKPDTPASDAKSVDAAYSGAVKGGKSQAQAAAAATERLNDISIKHADNPQYVNQVLQAAKPTLDKASAVLGDNSKNKSSYSGDEDHQAIDHIVSDLSEVTARGNDFTALSISSSIASQLADSKELNHADDAFYKHLDSGGDSRLFNTLIGVAEKTDHGQAADGLRERGGGSFFDRVVDGAKSTTGVVGDAANAVKDFAIDAATGVAKVVTKAGEVAVDYAKGTVDIVGDAAKATAKDVKATANAAKEAGLTLGAKALGWVHSRLREAVNDLVDEKKIKALGPGDSYKVHADLSGAVEGVAIDGNTSLTVSRNDDGTYTVATDLGVGVGTGIAEHEGKVSTAEASATGTTDARVELKFANADDAVKGARLVAQTAVASSSPVAYGAGFTPSKGDLTFLKQHVSAIELTGGASASAAGELSGDLAGQFGLDDTKLADQFAQQLLGDKLAAKASLDGSVKLDNTLRIEFENGKPATLVSKQKITIDGSAAADSPELRANLEKAGIKVPDLSAEGSFSVEVETRIPVTGAALDSPGEVKGLAFDPSDLRSTGGKVETSATVRAEGAASGGEKHSIEWKITNIDANDVPEVVDAVIKKDYCAIAKEIDVEQTVETSKTDSADFEIPFGVGAFEGGRDVEDRTSHKSRQVA